MQVWRAPPIGAEVSTSSGGRQGLWTMFRQGALCAVTNPKGLLFFAAFLPQFVDPTRSLLLQFALMAATFVGIEIVTEMTLAGTAHRIRPWLQRVGRRFNQACGGVFAAIGVALPLRGVSALPLGCLSRGFDRLSPNGRLGGSGDPRPLSTIRTEPAAHHRSH